MKERAHVVVSGRVQGVFFRYETKREAEKRGVTGWVRNLHDGRLEAVFEGERRQVVALVEFCKRGPPHAKVDLVRVQWKSYTGSFSNFKIRY